MDAIGLIGLIVAIIALVLTVTIERLKKPSIKIEASEWRNPSFAQWTFATARVKNRELWPWVRWFIERPGAQGCKVEIEYYQWDSTAPFLRIPGRWSNAPQPIGWVPSSLATSPSPTSGGPTYLPLAGIPVTGAPSYTPVQPPVSGGTAPTTSPAAAITPAPPAHSNMLGGAVSGGNSPDYVIAYDASLDPGQHDITTDPEGKEIAVAILRNGEVFAFSTESYKYPVWGNPDWRLDLKQVYKIVISVHGAGVRKKRSFRLDCLEANPAQFRLKSAGKSNQPWRFGRRA